MRGAMEEKRASDTIGRRLAAIASRFPEQRALVEGDAAITFVELDAAASGASCQIAAAVRDRPGFVGLLFDSKLAAAQAIFGAARSGRAYVPLDTSDPDERLRFILSDSEAIAL